MDGIVPRPKVLVPEKLSPDGLALLQKSLDVHERKGLTAEQLIDIIPEYEALLVRSETKVTAELLRAGRNLKVVARAGVGVDNVDVPAASKLGIVVVNSPQGNIQAAAEHTVALLMSMARNIPDACASTKAGKWERSRLTGVEVKGKTLGIIGLGKVGLIVARMARGLGMNIMASDPYASAQVAASNNVTLVQTLTELLPQVDFLTIHTPMLASTKGMLSIQEINSMKPGARILNVARGGIVDEKALLDALESGHLDGAAIDVFTLEPPSKDPEGTAAKLIAHPKCVVTPHLGASTKEAQENVSIDVCEQVLSILAGDLPRSAVNAPIILPAEYKTLQPFVKLVEKMGSIYMQHFTSPHTVGGPQAFRNTFDLIYEGALASLSNTKPLFAAFVKGLLSPISDDTTGINVNIVNAEMIAKERGIFVNEQKSRDPSSTLSAYSSLVTLVARPPSRPSSLTRIGNQDLASKATGEKQQHIISGYVSDGRPFISRLDRFSTSFSPDDSGTILICHNYDAPGKIGVVGSILGRENVNINFMSVAPAGYGDTRYVPGQNGTPTESGVSTPTRGRMGSVVSGNREALMILGVDGDVRTEVAKELIGAGGVLSVSIVTL